MSLALALQKRVKDRGGTHSLAHLPLLISEVTANSPRQWSNRVLVVVKRAERGREEVEAVARSWRLTLKAAFSDYKK